MSPSINMSTSLASLPDCLPALTQLALLRARRADVILGMPAHDCRFHGICRIEECGTSPVVSQCACKNEKVTGWFLRPQFNHCVILIKKGTLSLSREKYHFARSDLLLSEPVDVTPFCNKKGDKQFFLRKGEYPLRSTKDFYVLSIPLISHI